MADKQNDWKQVADDAIVSWENTQTFEGVFIEKEKIVGLDQKENFVYFFEEAGVRKKVFGTVVLNRLLQKIVSGTHTKIIFKGKNKRTSMFEVYTK